MTRGKPELLVRSNSRRIRLQTASDRENRDRAERQEHQDPTGRHPQPRVGLTVWPWARVRGNQRGFSEVFGAVTEPGFNRPVRIRGRVQGNYPKRELLARSSARGQIPLERGGLPPLWKIESDRGIRRPGFSLGISDAERQRPTNVAGFSRFSKAAAKRLLQYCKTVPDPRYRTFTDIASGLGRVHWYACTQGRNPSP